MGLYLSSAGCQEEQALQASVSVGGVVEDGTSRYSKRMDTHVDHQTDTHANMSRESVVSLPI